MISIVCTSSCNLFIPSVNCCFDRMTKSRLFMSCHPFVGHCGKCRRVRGKGERQRQYCQKDFGEFNQYVSSMPKLYKWCTINSVLDDDNACVCYHSISSKSAGKSLSWWGDPLWCPNHPHIPKPLSSGAPGVPVGAQQMWLSLSGGGASVCVDAATAC